VTPGGRVIKPGTYFDADPELTIEEHRCIGTAILQDSANTQMQTECHIHRHRNTQTATDDGIMQ